jgi:hypothetical protein
MTFAQPVAEPDRKNHAVFREVRANSKGRWPAG